MYVWLSSPGHRSNPKFSKTNQHRRVLMFGNYRIKQSMLKSEDGIDPLLSHPQQKIGPRKRHNNRMKGNKSNNRHTHWLSVDSQAGSSPRSSWSCCTWNTCLILSGTTSLSGASAHDPGASELGSLQQTPWRKCFFLASCFFLRTPAAQRRVRCLPCPGGGENCYLVFNGEKAPSSG